MFDSHEDMLTPTKNDDEKHYEEIGEADLKIKEMRHLQTHPTLTISKIIDHSNTIALALLLSSFSSTIGK